MQTQRTRKAVFVTVAVVALALVAASTATAQFAGSEGPGEGVDTSEDGFGDMEQDDAADAVYIRDDGSGVLVYNGSGDTNGSVSFGADMSTGLLHFLANGTGGEGFEGDFSMEAEPTSWFANGSFVATDTGMLEDLNVDITSQTDSSDSSFDGEVDATVSSGLAALAPTASTEGEIVTEPDRLTSSGSLDFQTATGGSSVREVRRFDLTQSDGSYVLDSRERRIVRPEIGRSVAERETGVDTPSDTDSFGSGSSDFSSTIERTDPAERWGTRERAEETLNEQYTKFADNVSATADLTLESYSFENVTVEDSFGTVTNESVIDVEYTVEYTGVQEGIADTLAEEMSGNASQETADEFAQGIRNLSINELSYASVSDEDGSEFNWSVDVENYNDLFRSTMRLASEMQPEGTGMGAGDTASSSLFSGGYYDEILNMSERQMEAAEAADLVSTWEWSGSLESEGGMGGAGGFGGGGGGATATLTADISHDTENWGSYVNELEDRDIPVANSSFDLSASTTNAGVEGDMRWEASGEALAEGYQTTLNTYESTFQDSDEIDSSVFRHINNSGFRVAKIDATVGNGTWDVEAGAAFENGSALSAAIETETGYGVTQVVGKTENGSTSTYVKSDSLVDDPTQEAVRSLETVDNETAVNLPGDWDRDFPEMDTGAAAEYLGVEEGGPGDNGSPLPGFGAVVALVALVAVAVAHRHRD